MVTREPAWTGTAVRVLTVDTLSSILTYNRSAIINICLKENQFLSTFKRKQSDRYLSISFNLADNLKFKINLINEIVNGCTKFTYVKQLGSIDYFLDWHGFTGRGGA